MYGGHPKYQSYRYYDLNQTQAGLHGGSLYFPGATLQLLSYGPGQFPSNAKADAHMYVHTLYIPRARGGTNTQIPHKYIPVCMYSTCTYMHTYADTARQGQLSLLTMAYCRHYHHYRHHDSASSV